MNKTAMELTRIFGRECAALAGIEELQKEVEAAVYQKKWTDFDGCLAKLKTLSAELQTLENERLLVFEAGRNFYLWAAELEQTERCIVMDAYRALKKWTARVQASNAAFTEYLREMQFMVEGFLDAAFPERRAAMYGRQGTICGADMRRVVLDKRF